MEYCIQKWLSLKEHDLFGGKKDGNAVFLGGGKTWGKEEDSDQLKDLIETQMREIPQAEIQRACRAVPGRFQICEEVGGDHLFKKKWRWVPGGIFFAVLSDKFLCPFEPMLISML